MFVLYVRVRPSSSTLCYAFLLFTSPFSISLELVVFPFFLNKILEMSLDTLEALLLIKCNDFFVISLFVTLYDFHVHLFGKFIAYYLPMYKNLLRGRDCGGVQSQIPEKSSANYCNSQRSHSAQQRIRPFFSVFL